jgi:rhodanese-related sulfurtransferase
MISSISREELHHKLIAREPLVLAEALDAPYFVKGHLPGAINMPLSQIGEVAAKSLPDTSALVVVYCASSTCKNSDIAARKLEAMGYANVRVFGGGKADWTDGGFPLEVAS